jgi:hypothetical protein
VLVVHEQPVVRAIVLIMLYPMVYLALRGRRGPARGGDAVVLTVFAWLSNSLVASLHYLLAVA